MDTRFSRTIRLLGEERFNILQTRLVTIVGLGAVGGYVLEGLVRAGVCNLRLVDFDTIQPSNLNRQLLALEDTLGMNKAEAARQRALAINPDCRVEVLNIFAGEETLPTIFQPRPDLLIDAIDSLNPKTQLLHGAWLEKIPTISSMGAALRTDPTFIRSGNIFETSNCPLARHLRKRLRRRGVDPQGSPEIFCVYSTEKVDFDYNAENETISRAEAEPSPYADRGRSRNVLGSLATITGIFGLTIANHAILRLSDH